MMRSGEPVSNIILCFWPGVPTWISPTNAFKSANSSFTSPESDRLPNIVSLTTPRCSPARLKCTSAYFAYLAATLLAFRSRGAVPFTFPPLASRWSGMLNWAETRLSALSVEAVKRKKIFMIFQGANPAVTCHDKLIFLKLVPDTGGLADLHGNLNHAIVCAANYAGHWSGRCFDFRYRRRRDPTRSSCDEQNCAL